ncbi:unnamed protein product [Rotaria sp. Silwood2]|nr:unnamed protein product [Rotaria sp. Silwood2]
MSVIFYYNVSIIHFFYPAAYLSLNNADKYQCEKYIKILILNDVYSQKNSLIDITQAATTTVAFQLQSLLSQNKSFKVSTYDDFISASGDQDYAVENIKENRERICLNEGLKFFKAAVQEFNSKSKPSTT